MRDLGDEGENKNGHSVVLRLDYGKEKEEPVQTISGDVTTSKWRTVLDRYSEDAKDLPPVPAAKVMREIIYGLVNVRTDGKRLLIAVRNEGNKSWACETIEPEEIARAYCVVPASA